MPPSRVAPLAPPTRALSHLAALAFPADVTLVIDGGLHRFPSCDERTGIAHLRTARISLASARQRAGRAGRVRAGTCYHLFCRVEAEGGMAEATTAEILRVPLESTVLVSARVPGHHACRPLRAARPLAMPPLESARTRTPPHRATPSYLVLLPRSPCHSACSVSSLPSARHARPPSYSASPSSRQSCRCVLLARSPMSHAVPPCDAPCEEPLPETKCAPCARGASAMSPYET